MGSSPVEVTYVCIIWGFSTSNYCTKKLMFAGLCFVFPCVCISILLNQYLFLEFSFWYSLTRKELIGKVSLRVWKVTIGGIGSFTFFSGSPVLTSFSGTRAVVIFPNQSWKIISSLSTAKCFAWFCIKTLFCPEMG